MDLFASLVAGDLLIEARDRTPQMLRLDWTGRSNSRHPGPLLSPYFEAVLLRARAAGCAIEAHFEQLEFLNSSTITALIQFIQEARAQGTALSLLFDGGQKWQALSFEALRSLELPDGLLQIRPASPSN